MEEEPDLSDVEESPGLNSPTSWRQARRKRRRREEEASSAGQQVVSHLLAPPLEQSGRETPVSVDSIPLEWDHTVDVGGSSHEEDEEAPFFSALSGRVSHHLPRGSGSDVISCKRVRAAEDVKAKVLLCKS